MPDKVTIKQVAEKLGVSMMTISRALNNRPNVDENTRKKVVETARKMGYIQNQIARSLVQKKTYTIGVVVPEITHSFFPDAIKGIEEVFNQADYQIILTHSAEDSNREVKAIETLASKRVDGILISMAETVKDYSIYKQILQMSVPIVFFDRCVFNIGASCISIDDEKAAFLITEHLIKQKNKRIAHLSGPLTVSIGRSRLNGYKKALTKNDIVFNDKLVKKAGFHETGGYEAMKELLAQNKKEIPDAVVCVNDPVAFGAIKAIEEAGLKVPDDIRITGFSDDIRASLINPPLTTIRQPAYEVGKMAARKLLNHINNNEEPIEEIKVATELIIRQSSMK